MNSIVPVVESELSVLKNRLALLKEELSSVKEAIKQSKDKVPRKSKAKSGSVKTTSNPSIPPLEEEVRQSLMENEWSAFSISEWLEIHFQEIKCSNPLLPLFIKKVNSNFDNPKCGGRTITSSIKPTLKKWADSTALLQDTTTQTHTFIAIAAMYAIVDARVLALKGTPTPTPTPTPKVVTFSNGSMTVEGENDDVDIPIDDSNTSQSDPNETDEIDDLVQSLDTLTLKPESVPPLSEVEYDSELNHEDDEDTDELMSHTFIDLFQGHEMDCLSHPGFTTTSKINGRSTMIIISFNGTRLASSLKNKWTYTESAEIPLAMISSEDV